jgi:uncharacterized repeat protein (TIGR03803 family)
MVSAFARSGEGGMNRKQIFMTVLNARGIALLTLLLVAAVVGQPAQAQTYTVLHAFTSGTDGADPSPILRDAQGNLYGTTEFGGIPSCGEDTCGTVFKIDNAGNETVLYSFEGGNNGSDPVAGLVEDAAGNLYGTTRGNGFISGAAVVFKLEPNGQETSFDIAGLNACCFDSPLAVDAHGNLYGMSPYGGEPNCGLNSFGLGCGALFKVTPAGEFSVLHVFTGNDGMQPEGGVVLDAKGNLYGSANFGGELSCKSLGYGYPEPGCGTVYKLDSSGNFTVLHTFGGEGDGSFPLGVIIDNAGDLYGIAQNGGDEIKNSNYEYGLGTVFEVNTSGEFSVLYTFVPCNTPPCKKGQVRNPVYASHLVRDSKGNLYGLEQSNDCALGGGCFFKIGKKGKLDVLYAFEGEDGSPYGFDPVGVVMGSSGDFYGSMYLGGGTDPECAENGFTYGCGTVFHLTF